MKRFLFPTLFLLFCFSLNLSAQIPTATLVQIVKAEDERRFDTTLENLLKNKNAKIRERAALAIGRIGDERAVDALTNLLKDDSVEVQTMAMFALGEIESSKASKTIADVLNDSANTSLRARALEAAGKIAAANPKDTAAPALAKAIISALNYELSRGNAPNYETVLLGETAVLRARPAGGEEIMIRLLSEPNARLRADALNTLARLRSKNANDKARELLQNDPDAVVRANAARMLGVGEDKSAIDLLLNAATKDSDSRVRVSAIRSLGILGDASIAEKLLFRPRSFPRENTNSFGCAVEASKNVKSNPLAFLECDFYFKSEMLEITTTLGKLLPNTNNQNAVSFLQKFGEYDKYQSPEVEIAYAKIAPTKFSEYQTSKNSMKLNWQSVSATMQGYGELANLPDSKEFGFVKSSAKLLVLAYITTSVPTNQAEDKTLSDALTSYAAFKSDGLSEVARKALLHKDAIVRATAAGILADIKPDKENIEALKTAFDSAFIRDKHENDAELAILEALFKLDKKESLPTLIEATNSQDYLVRKKAFDYLKDDSFKDSDLVKITLDKFLAKKKNQVLPYSYSGSKLGVILNTQADYVRAVSRKNGTVKAILTTTKGSFTIDLMPEDAPLTVDNFIKLARSNYFNGVSVHRVVPNFVMQDGDPRGDGNGGPGWQIRCEINMLSYERGAVGMALSGKDTGGSQWFVTHSPQPHLDGGYTVFGKVNEPDMKIVDSIVRGDKILSVKITEEDLPRKVTKITK